MAKGTMPKPPKLKTCPICKSDFTPWSTTQKTCSDWQCGLAFSRQQKAEKEAREARIREKAERADIRERKAALKSDGDLKKEAQKAFNAFIRARDYDQPCISCGNRNPPNLPGGQWDCGHFKTVGGFPELRFVERNAYKQCKPCNAGSAKYQAKAVTVEAAYRANLTERFGPELVEWLDGPHEMTNYRRDDFIRIRDEYRKKTRELLKQRGPND